MWSWWQKFKVWFFGYAFLRIEQKRGWIGGLPIYLVRCKEHGLFEGNRVGLYGYFFQCPKCF